MPDITTRQTKGSPLTHAEMDANLNAVNNMHIQATQPVQAGPYLWIQTNYGDADGFTLWLEDGS